MIRTVQISDVNDLSDEGSPTQKEELYNEPADHSWLETKFKRTRNVMSSADHLAILHMCLKALSERGR